METHSTSIQPRHLDYKELKDSELVALHKTIFEKFIRKEISSLKKRNHAVRIYEAYINPENIRLYYNAKIRIFTIALVTGRLDSIKKHSTF
jgi:hypothetical protein